MERHAVEAVPPDLQHHFDAARAAAGLDLPTRIVLVTDLRGSGGLFVDGEAVNLVVIGSADVSAITEQIWESRIRLLHPVEAVVLKELGHVVVRKSELRRHVETEILHHEVGHAFRAEWGQDTTVVRDEELGADDVAGRLDAALGRRREFGTVVFEAAGCADNFCCYPRPAERVRAHAAGYDAQLQVEVRRAIS